MRKAHSKLYNRTNYFNVLKITCDKENLSKFETCIIMAKFRQLGNLLDMLYY